MMAKWWANGWAVGCWAAVAASGVAWGLKLFVAGQPVPPQATVVAAANAPRGDLTRLLGADPAPAAAVQAPASARFQLIGVVAPRGALPSRDGVALIAIDGRPPKAYRVGTLVEGDTVLQAVAQRGASLGPRDGPATVSLDIPPPPSAATGVMPPANGPAGAAGNLPQTAPGLVAPRPGPPGFVPPPRVQPPPPVENPGGQPGQALPTQ